MKKLLFALLISISAFAQIDKVEPPFWWNDMTHSDVQIMFYGKNIAQNEVTVSNGIIIKGIQKTENPNYLFVTIETKNIPAQDFVFTFKNGKKSFTQTYSLKSRRENSRFRKSFDSSDMMYLIMSDRFANGNPNNDNNDALTEKADRTKDNGRHGGDIEGIIKNLDYIKELGATAVWPTPLCEDNDERGSYHTYGQSDVYKIDARFGTNEDYVRMSAELHKRGMKNIMDYVTNHWGYKHWMMNDLPTYDWLNQFPGFKQTNYKMTTQFDPNASAIDTKNCMDGWFVKSMPDLNQNNPLVLNYLIQNAIWWIEYADLDGFRVDTYSYADKQGIATWTKAITDEYPNFNIVGEAWLYTHAQIAYWQKDSKVAAIQSYNSNLPSVMDFMLQGILGGGVFNENKGNWNEGVTKLYDSFTNDFLYPDVNKILLFAENHDTNRLNEVYKNDFKKYQMAMTIIATVRGIPQVYYGSEIGMAGDKGKGDGDIRRDFPGGWNGDTNNAFTKTGRTEEQNKFFDFTAKLFNWRKSKTVIHNGKTTHYIPENNVYVYFRYNEKESIMVVVNNNEEKQTFKSNTFQENLKNYKSGKDVLSDASFDLKNDISIEGKSVLVLELK
ncbi:glycoside hydrolase family 13 protein [Flavobacterium buctense]|uniref:Glycoside hydrolase family 13 protein n=1 Tax=Flavobacterium buctense TaxID=1648146 RepID=A0ABU9E0C6_9FLAO|nr:glycoside hydrolase family 13 protein [Flavobacterium buctense]